jgi:2-polyprenyl-3-methyl-5-hydroxy-6-metoxy-1,4-benzoquinol methylase
MVEIKPVQPERMRTGNRGSSSQRLRYTPLEPISVGRPVDRIKYIAAACAGRRVLDLGAMDETAWQSKRGRGNWLHEEIARVARHVDGIDSSDVIPADGLATARNALIRRGDITELDRLIAESGAVPDVVVAGELIEHLENPLQFLRRVAETSELAGCTLIISTPNATALHNILIGLARRESTHHDHLCILSYKTLMTLCRRAGFSQWEIIPYSSRFTEMQERHSGLSRLAVRAVERIINCVEWLFPLLSFGYIVQVRL